MNKFLLTTFILLLVNHLTAQNIFDYNKSYYNSIPDSITFSNTEMESTKIGGVSGICKSTVPGEYLLVVDKASPLPGYFKANIKIEGQLDIRFIDFIPFNDPTIEGEAIQITPYNNKVIITNERDHSSEIITINEEGIETASKWYSNYSKPMQFNSGYEGLCFSHNGDFQFVAIERPLSLPEEVYKNYKIAPVVPIIRENRFSTEKEKTIFGYPLQGKTNGNGVSEILYIEKNLLWVIERSYIRKENRNIVSIYAVDLQNTIFLGDLPIGFHGITEILRPQKVITFGKEITLGNDIAKPGNIEGACFSHDGKYLILITDNNYGNKDHTPTQIYAIRLAE